MADAATIAKLEEGFKKLEAATDCKSLLKKYLSKSIFDQLKDKKTGLGATLLDVIQSGKFSSCNFNKDLRLEYNVREKYFDIDCRCNLLITKGWKYVVFYWDRSLVWR